MNLSNLEASKEQASDRSCGELIRAARARVGMTRQQLAVASGASERYLALLEGGEGNPSINILAAIAEALAVPMVELLPRGGERNSRAAQLAREVRKLSPHRQAELERWLARPSSVLDEMRGRRIVLIGLRGAGKSTLGKLLSERIAAPFFEMSERVEREYGGNIGLLIEMNGPGALHQFEAQAWERICAENERAVIAASGGIVADPVLYERILQTAHTVWLQATPADHMARVIAQGDLRPMDSNRHAMRDLEAILEARSSEYARAGTHINTSAGAMESVLERLEACARSVM
jgi:XRE family transcriptional regulator, aerobic/anaerobic benzoate catabolism transcriptional regulator